MKGMFYLCCGPRSWYWAERSGQLLNFLSQIFILSFELLIQSAFRCAIWSLFHFWLLQVWGNQRLWLIKDFWVLSRRFFNIWAVYFCDCFFSHVWSFEFQLNLSENFSWSEGSWDLKLAWDLDKMRLDRVILKIKLFKMFGHFSLLLLNFK